MLTPPTCATHPHVILRCFACVGAKGGSVSSRTKTKAAQENGLKTRLARLKARRLRRAAKLTPSPEKEN